MEERDHPFAILAKHQAKPPVNVEAIAQDFGLKVNYLDLGSEISGQIMRDPVRGGKSGFAIYINSTHHSNRQRFSLAHEIAHYILHRDLIESGVVDDTMYRSDELNSHYESQANRMAADILMPIRLVKAYRTQHPKLDDLAKVFQVSTGAMEIRINSIKS